MAFSWAADKLKQALDRVHRLNSVKPINVYVVFCNGSIDRRLEALTQEKTDASELVLDGRLIGERSEEVKLAELLKVARREFNDKDAALDEGLLQAQWPHLRQRLDNAMRRWIEIPVQVEPVQTLQPVLTIPVARSVPSFACPTVILRGLPIATRTLDRHDPLITLTVQTPAPGMPPWKLRVRARVRNPDVWISF